MEQHPIKHVCCSLFKINQNQQAMQQTQKVVTIFVAFVCLTLHTKNPISCKFETFRPRTTNYYMTMRTYKLFTPETRLQIQKSAVLRKIEKYLVCFQKNDDNTENKTPFGPNILFLEPSSHHWYLFITQLKRDSFCYSLINQGPTTQQPLKVTLKLLPLLYCNNITQTQIFH